MISLGLGIVLVGLAAAAYTPDAGRAQLEAKYLASPADYIEVAGLRLHYRDTGPRGAPSIVLLHGFGSSLQTWDAWADALSAQYRVIRYDLPGFGLTGPDPTGDYSDARSLQVLGALLDRLGLAQTTLIGNSIGGKLAWQFAAQNPARVTCLVLVSPDGFASPGFDYGKPASVPAMLRLLPYFMPKFLLRMSLAPAYGDPARLSDDTVTRYWELMRAPGVRRAMVARLEQTVMQDPEPSLRQLKMPVLLVWGEKDGMIPFSNSADYLRVLPTRSLAPFANLGHVPQEEAPAESLAPVLAFLGAQPEAGKP
jgi:pimeloyl-ACP methyl ester carboxylesterase